VAICGHVLEFGAAAPLFDCGDTMKTNGCSLIFIGLS
jgi:hypothetical protein